MIATISRYGTISREIPANGQKISYIPVLGNSVLHKSRTVEFVFSSPVRRKNPDTPKGIRIFGAVDGTRTRTVSLPGDFKSPVSTDSTTTAAKRYDTTFFIHRQVEASLLSAHIIRQDGCKNAPPRPVATPVGSESPTGRSDMERRRFSP